MSKTNQREIARYAGVSLSTVSRVLSNHPHVDTDTRHRVLKVVHDLGNGMRPKYMVGLIIPDAKNPYFTDMAFAFSTELSKYAGAAVVMSSDGQLDKELLTIEYMKNMQLDGMVFVPASDGAETVVRFCSNIEMPILVMDREVSIESIDFIASEYAQPIRSAIDFLVAHSHRRIACLCGPQETHTGRNRLEAFRQAMYINKLPVDDQLLFFGRYNLISGRQCGEVLLGMPADERPTAIFACNDLMAIGLMQRLQEGGWKLPEQLSVIGFDNIEWSQWTHPTLCTIGQHVPTLAKEAVALVLGRINEMRKSKKPASTALNRKAVRLMLPAKFIPRASVTRPWVGLGIRGLVVA